MADTGVGGRRRKGGDSRRESSDQGQESLTRAEDGIVELRRSRARILLAADGDRHAIEHALHDGLQQQLVALASGLRQARGLVDADASAAKASLDDLAALAREAIDEAARLAAWIHPPRLHDARALPGSLRGVAARLGITVTVEVATAAVHPPETWAALYWCCREALSLAPSGTQATVNVRDRDGGVGFEVGVAGAYAEGRSERLRDRVETLGGWLDVDATDVGSRIAGLVPSP